MSEPAAATLQVAPWDDTRNDEPFCDLRDAIDGYHFEEDEVTTVDGIVVRTLYDPQANYGSAAFEQIVALACDAGLWTKTIDDDHYDWIGNIAIYSPGGKIVFSALTPGSEPVATSERLQQGEDLDEYFQFANQSLAAWVVSDGNPPVIDRNLSKQVAAGALARLRTSDGATAQVWELALRYATETACEGALKALASNSDVPPELRTAAALAL